MAYYLVDFENVKSRGMEGVELLNEEDTVCIFYSENADSMTFDLHRKLNETKATVIYHKVAVGTKNALDFQLATYLGYLICEQQKGELHPEYYIVTKDNGFSSLVVYWRAEKVPVRMIHSLLWGRKPDPVADKPEEESVCGQAEPAETPDTPEHMEEAAAAEAEPEETVQDKVMEKVPEAVTEAAPAAEEKETPRTGKTAARKTTGKRQTEKKKEKSSDETKAKADELTLAVEKVVPDKEIVPQVVKFIRQYKTKQGINNALNKEFKDSKRTSEIYSAIKPLIADKKGK